MNIDEHRGRLATIRQERLDAFVRVVGDAKEGLEICCNKGSMEKAVAKAVETLKPDQVEQFRRRFIQHMRSSVIDLLSASIYLAINANFQLEHVSKAIYGLRHRQESEIELLAVSDALDQLSVHLKERDAMTRYSFAVDAFDDWTNDHFKWDDCRKMTEYRQISPETFMDYLTTILECLAVEAEAAGIDSTNIIIARGDLPLLAKDIESFDLAMDAAWAVVKRLKAKIDAQRTVAKPTKSKKSRVQPDHPVTVWFRQHGSKYKSRAAAVRAYIENHGGNYQHLYDAIGNDKNKPNKQKVRRKPKA